MRRATALLLLLGATACDHKLGVEQPGDVLRPYAARMSEGTAADLCIPQSRVIERCLGPIGNDGRASIYLLHQDLVVPLGRFRAQAKETGISIPDGPQVWVQGDEAVWPGLRDQSTIYLYRDRTVREIKHAEGDVTFVALSADGEIWASVGKKDFAVIGLDGATVRYEDGPPFAYHDLETGEWVQPTR